MLRLNIPDITERFEVVEDLYGDHKVYRAKDRLQQFGKNGILVIKEIPLTIMRGEEQLPANQRYISSENEACMHELLESARIPMPELYFLATAEKGHSGKTLDGVIGREFIEGMVLYDSFVDVDYASALEQVLSVHTKSLKMNILPEDVKASDFIVKEDGSLYFMDPGQFHMFNFYREENIESYLKELPKHFAEKFLPGVPGCFSIKLDIGEETKRKATDIAAKAKNRAYRSFSEFERDVREYAATLKGARLGTKTIQHSTEQPVTSARLQSAPEATSEDFTEVQFNILKESYLSPNGILPDLKERVDALMWKSLRVNDWPVISNLVRCKPDMLISEYEMLLDGLRSRARKEGNWPLAVEIADFADMYRLNGETQFSPAVLDVINLAAETGLLALSKQRMVSKPKDPPHFHLTGNYASLVSARISEKLDTANAANVELQKLPIVD